MQSAGRHRVPGWGLVLVLEAAWQKFPPLVRVHLGPRIKLAESIPAPVVGKSDVAGLCFGCTLLASSHYVNVEYRGGQAFSHKAPFFHISTIDSVRPQIKEV